MRAETVLEFKLGELEPYAMSSAGEVRYHVADRIATLTLDRPPVNAFSLTFLDAILAAFRKAGDDGGVRAVVLESAQPKIFCAGLDLDILLGQPASEIRKFLQKLYIDLYDVQYNMGKPTIAAINGATRGGGMTLAISCDVLLASKTATFGYPEIDLGVLPAIHFAYLPRVVGRHRAFELLFSGRSFDAEEARELGLVSRVVAPSELAGEARRLAQTFATKAPGAVQQGRAAFMRTNDLDYRRSIANAVEDFCNSATTAEAQEGLRAFLEKREPNWA